MSASQSTSSGGGSGRQPLEPLELYMLADDAERYPRAFMIGLEFDGEIDSANFEKVLAEVVSHESRLTAVVSRGGLFGRDWKSSNRSPPVAWVSEGPLPDSLAARRLNLRSEAGLRVIGIQGAAGSRMFHVFHHACCDGLGALAFLGRLYAEYSRAVRPESPVQATRVQADSIGNFRPADDLARRMGSELEARKASRRRVWEVLTARTARLVSATGNGRCAPAENPVPFPGTLTHVVGHHETRELKRAARRNLATLNDLLLCAMFRTLRKWNGAHSPTVRDESYQIMVPADLRSPDHDGLPAANLVSCFFVRLPGRTCDDPDELLRAVAARTDYAVQSRSGLIMYYSIRRLTRVPGLLRLVLKAWRTQATALVSYVGDAGRAMQATFPKRRGRFLIGNLELTQITATGPVRPGTAANLTAGTYAGELVLNLTLDPHLFNASDTEEMLGMIVEHLLDYARDVKINRKRFQAVSRA